MAANDDVDELIAALEGLSILDLKRAVKDKKFPFIIRDVQHQEVMGILRNIIEAYLDIVHPAQGTYQTKVRDCLKMIDIKTKAVNQFLFPSPGSENHSTEYNPIDGEEGLVLNDFHGQIGYTAEKFAARVWLAYFYTLMVFAENSTLLDKAKAATAKKRFNILILGCGPGNDALGIALCLRDCFGIEWKVCNFVCTDFHSNWEVAFLQLPMPNKNFHSGTIADIRGTDVHQLVRTSDFIVASHVIVEQLRGSRQQESREKPNIISLVNVIAIVLRARSPAAFIEVDVNHKTFNIQVDDCFKTDHASVEHKFVKIEKSLFEFGFCDSTRTLRNLKNEYKEAAYGILEPKNMINSKVFKLAIHLLETKEPPKETTISTKIRRAIETMSQRVQQKTRTNLLSLLEMLIALRISEPGIEERDKNIEISWTFKNRNGKIMSTIFCILDDRHITIDGNEKFDLPGGEMKAVVYLEEKLRKFSRLRS